VRVASEALRVEVPRPGRWTLAVVLSLDTLKTCVVVDSLTGSQHDSNRELFGQGVGNALSAVLGGVPGSGTSGPTLMNVASGAETRWSAVFEGTLIMISFLLLGGIVGWTPLAALAGILVVVAARIADAAEADVGIRDRGRLRAGAGLGAGGLVARVVRFIGEIVAGPDEHHVRGRPRELGDPGSSRRLRDRDPVGVVGQVGAEALTEGPRLLVGHPGHRFGRPRGVQARDGVGTPPTSSRNQRYS
jgi:hypothetical protein